MTSTLSKRGGLFLSDFSALPHREVSQLETRAFLLRKGIVSLLPLQYCLVAIGNVDIFGICRRK